LQAEQAALKAQIAELQSQIGGIKLPDVAPLDARIDAVEAALNELPAAGGADNSGEIAALAERLAKLEGRPLTEGADPAAVAAFEGELARLQSSFADQRAEIEEMLANAQALDAASAEAARVAAAQTALARMRAALDDGSTFDALVAELGGLNVKVDAALADQAGAGVPTLALLREGFAPAAREALAVAREEGKAGAGLAAFVQRQLGARSVSPRDGDDPDAVLSRAEAAVASNALTAALAELEGLPEAARTALSGWEAKARARQSALAAAEALAQSLNAK
jgi:hypothetical protein